MLTDRGTEFCGNPEHHEYELYLAVEDIDHSRTKTKSPQTNGIVERFHKTMLNEFYRIAFRKKLYGSIAGLQADLDQWLDPAVFQRLPLPYTAGWLAAQAFVKYRRAGGTKDSPLPDFYIGAHAETEGLTLVTRDTARYRTYFPSVTLIFP